MEPLFFQQLNGQDKVVFREDGASGISYAFSSQVPHMALVKLAGYETPTFHYFVLALCVLLFLTAALGWPIAALSRILCRRKCEGVKAPKAARWLAGVMSGLFVLTLLGVLASVSNVKELMAGVPPILKFSLVLPLLAAVLGIGVLIFTAMAWAKRYWTRCHRLHYTLVLLAGLAFLWFLNFWNLLGWHF